MPTESTTRLDAEDTIFFERELEQKKAKAYEKKYPELKARLFIPVVTEYDPAVETIVYEMLDMVGMAKVITNYAKDLPRADVKGVEKTAKVKSLGSSFGYSIIDIRRARLANKPLEQRKANACRKAILTKEDDIGAIGDSTHGLLGILNHPNIPVISAIDIGGGVTNWASKTDEQILDDMNLMVSTVRVNTNSIESPDTMLLPPSLFTYISQKRLDNTQTTILKFFMESNPWIRNVDEWHYLETAGVGAARRSLCYRRDPDYLELAVPQDYEHPTEPQKEGLEIVQPAHSRTAGVIVRYPLSAVYMDGM